MRRALGRVVVFFLATAVATVMTGAVLVQTAPVKNALIGFISEKIYESTGHRLACGHVRMVRPFQLEAVDLTLEAPDGQMVRLDHLRFRWHPYALIKNEFLISDVHIDGVAIEEGCGMCGPCETPAPWRPDLSQAHALSHPLRVKNAHIENIRIQHPLLPSELEHLEFGASFAFSPQDLQAQATVWIHDNRYLSGQSRFELQSYILTDNVLAVSIDLSESANGPISRILELSHYPSGDLHLEAHGRYQDWEHFISGNRETGENNLLGHFSFSGTGLLAQVDQLERFLGNDLAVSGDFTLLSDHTLHLDQLRGQNENTEFLGWLRVIEGHTLREMDLDLRIRNLKPFEELCNVQLAGDLGFKLRYKGMPQSQELSLQCASDLVKVEGFEVRDIMATFATQSPSIEQLDGLFLLDLKWEGVPVFVSSEVFSDRRDLIRFNQLAVNLGPTHLEGFAQWDQQDRSLMGEIRGRQQDLRSWSQYAKHRIEGIADMAITFEVESDPIEDRALQVVKVDFSAYDVATAEAQTPSLHVNLEVRDIFEAIHGHGRFATSNVKGTTWNLEHLCLNVGADPERVWSYGIQAKGRRYEDFDIATAGDFRISPNQLQLTVEKFLGSAANHQFRLRDYTELTINKMQILLTPLLLDVDDGILLAAVDSSLGSIDASLNLREIPLDILNAFRPTTPLEGTVTGHARLYGNREEPIGEVMLQLHSFRLIEPGFDHVTPIHGTLDLNLINRQLDVEANLHGLDKDPVNIAGRIPVGLSLDPWRVVESEQNRDLNLSVKAHGELGGFIHLFIPDRNRVAGDFDVDLQMLGTLDRPRVNGTVEIHNGEYHSLHTGAVFQNLNAHLEGQGPKLVLTKSTAEDPYGGTLSATGDISLRSGDDYTFHVNTVINNTRLFSRRKQQGAFSGNVRLTGNSEEGHLEGRLEVVRADLSIPDELHGIAPTVEVTYLNQPEYEPIPTLSVPIEDRWQLHLDLAVKASEQTFLRGRGLTSEWEGQGRVRGTTAKPLVYGDLRLVRGDFLFIGRNFTLTTGDVHFNGAPAKHTTINVNAELPLEGLTAYASLAGPIKEPSLNLRSNPSLPLKEVLARMLFDEEASEISPIQGIELAQALLAVSSNKHTPDIVGNLRRNFGLDRLDISHSEHDPNDVAVHAGKYLARGVFVSVNKSMNSSGNQVAVEMKISDNVKLEGSLGDHIEGSKVSLKWKRDY